MGTYKNISNELRSFFYGHKILKILIPLDIILLAGGLGIIVLNEFISVGGLLYALSFYSFLLGMLLTYANFNQNMLYAGFMIYGVVEIIRVLRGIFTKYYGFVDYHALLTAIIFGWIGYKIFKGSQTSNSVS